MNGCELEPVMEALERALLWDGKPLALHEPLFEGNEWAYVRSCLDEGWVSYLGGYVDRFEADLASFTGCAEAVVVSSGTAALHVCLLVAGVKAGDEVLVPALTFVASANAVSYLGAIPHFVDSEPDTLGLAPGRLRGYLEQIAEMRGGACFNHRTGRRIRAVMPMHTFGHPVDLDPLAEICDEFGLLMIEDAAESLGSYYKGRHTGNRGLLSALSFNGNKVITTGGGGAILTNDEVLAERARHLTTTARVPTAQKFGFSHDEIGFNYRMPNINAALGCAQLEQLPDYLKRKRALAARYRNAFADVEGVQFFVEPEFATSNYWLNVLLLDDSVADCRDDLLERTNSAGIMTRPAWVLMCDLPMYRDCPRMELEVARNLERRLINLPSSVALG